MKKLLSLLGVVTITGTSLTTLTSTNFISTKLENKNNLQMKNLKEWGHNVNLLVNQYCFLCHNRLVAYISHNTWQGIAFDHDTLNSSEFKNSLFSILNNFEKENRSEDSRPSDYIDSDDIKILLNVINQHYYDINRVFLYKQDNSIGLKIRTNRDSYWENNSKFWGVNKNTEE